MIARLLHVICDECGNPAEISDTEKEARAAAKRQGFVRVKGRDICWRCNPDSGRCTTCGVRPKNMLVDCSSRDGIHTAPGPAEQVGGGQGGE